MESPTQQLSTPSSRKSTERKTLIGSLQEKAEHQVAFVKKIKKKKVHHHLLVIDIQETREKFKHYKLCKAGYKGLSIYLIFCMLFLFDLKLQQHEPTLGRVNTGLSTTFWKQKPDLKVKDSATMWKFMAASAVPLLLNKAVKAGLNGEPNLVEETSNDYFYVLGGVTITAKQSWIKEDCMLGQPCYTEYGTKFPYIDLALPAVEGSEASTIKVPYRKDLGGYSVLLPATASAAEITALVQAYAPIFSGPQTREVRFDTILFNPHGEKTLSSLSFSGHVDVENDIAFTITPKTIPLYLYDEDHTVTIIIVAIEIFNVLFVMRFFIKPFWDALTGEPTEEDKHSVKGKQKQEEVMERNVLARLRYLSKWEYLPIDNNGEVIWKAPLFQWSVFFVAIAIWIQNIVKYRSLPDFLGQDAQTYFVSPFAGHETADLAKKLELAFSAMENVVLPFRDQVDDLCDTLQLYFTMQTLTVLMMTIRFFQYLTFQKRLSMVTDTFSAIFDDLLHISLVLLAVCFTSGAMSSLSFGSLDPEFQYLTTSWWEMIEQCFALFKPVAVTPYNPPLFKYVPHTMLVNNVIGWAPMMNMMFFKVLVTLLLFKLLMGVIMEGYKKKTRARSYPHNMREEISMLGYHMYQYFWLHKIRGKPYVSFEQLVLSLALIRESGKVDAERPWRSRYIGFSDGAEAIQQALNDVYTGDLPVGVDQAKKPKICALSKHFQFKSCGLREARWVLKQYGMPKKIAMYQLAEHVISTEERNMRERLIEERKNECPTIDEEIERRAEIYATGVLENMERKLETSIQDHHKAIHEGEIHEHSDHSSDPDHEGSDDDHHGPQESPTRHASKESASPSASQAGLALQFKIDDEDVRKVFDQYDFYGIGQIDIRFMAQAIGPDPGLGFDVPRHIMNELLKKYDDDDNRCYDLKEFSQMVGDPALQGRYAGSRMKAKRRTDKTFHRMATVMKVRNMMTKGVSRIRQRFQRGVHKAEALNSISHANTEPLLGNPPANSKA